MPKKLAPYVSRWRPVQPYKLGKYPALVANKRRLNAAVRHLPDHERLLLMAMGMQETNELTAAQRDAGKDNAGGAANYSLWNLNKDMLERLGYKGDFRKLNSDANVRIAADLMHKAFAKWGIDRTLAFVRGGYTGFVDGKSYGVADFRSGVATIAAVLCHNSPAILGDDRRVEVTTAHV